MTSTVMPRHQAVRRAVILNWITIGWNAIEGFVAIIAGTLAGSVSLIGFGLDSGIEVSAALILAWRLRKERQSGCRQPSDERARHLIAVSFAALAAYVGTTAVIDLTSGHQPESSIAGIVIAALSLLVMPLLAAHKRRLAVIMGSQAARAEASQTDLCTLLSAGLLLGLGANAALGWWWTDPLAGLFIACASAYMAVRTFTAEALTDTCCAAPDIDAGALG